MSEDFQKGAAQESQNEVRQRSLTIDDVADKVDEMNLLGLRPPTESEKDEAKAEPEQATSDEASAEPEEESSETADEAEEQRMLDLASIAERLGVEVDDLYSIEVATKIDGEEGRATLKDLQKSYQLAGHLNKRTQQLAEREKQMQQEFESRLTAKENELAGFIEIAREQLTKDIRSIDWNELRENDPQEYSRQWIAHKEREEQLNQAIEGFRNRVTERQQQQQQQIGEYLQHQQGVVLDLIPTWADQKVRDTEQAEMREILHQHYGFTPEEVGQVMDARQVALIRDAMLYRRIKSKKPDVSKKLREAPKPVKSGPKAESPNAKDRAVQDAKKAVINKAKTRRSNIDEVADYLYRKSNQR